MRPDALRGIVVHVWLWAALSVAPGCDEGSKPATQVIVTVTSDLDANTLTRVEVEVADASGARVVSMASSKIVADSPDEGEATLPLSFAVTKGEASTFLLTVHGYARSGSEPLVTQRVKAPFVDGTTLLLHVRLDSVCKDVACGPKQSCKVTDTDKHKAGECAPIVRLTKLPEIKEPRDFDPRRVQPDGGIADAAGETDAGGDPGDAGGDPMVDAAMDAGGDAAADAARDAGSCGASESCVTVPAGWNGPVIIEEDATETPSCPAAYPQGDFDAMRGLVAPAAACGCECVPPTNMDCGNGRLTAYDSSSCPPIVGNPSQVVTSCETTALSGSYWRAAASVDSQGTCEVDATEEVTPVSWSVHARACGNAGLESCGDASVCTPQPEDGGALCVWIEGDVACDDRFPNVTAYYTDASDSRECGACACGDATGGLCRASATFSDGCTVMDLAFPPSITNGCTAHSGASYVRMKVELEPGTCEPSGGASVGEAIPTGPITVCCQ